MSAFTEKYSGIMDESDEPSILSANPNERKLARKLRIQRRLDALSKQSKPEDERIEDITPIEKQVLDSINALEELAAEGTEVVSAVKVANDARELERRKVMQETRDRLLAALEEEDKKCMEKYLEISQKWPDILACKDPLDIHDELEAQNARCLEILDKKDALIAELKQELENADSMYAEEVKKQNEDIDVLVERMENQVHTMTKAYRHELMMVENVIESERKMLLKTSQDKWETLLAKYKEDTVEAREKKKEIMLEYEEEMKKAITEHQEEFRRLKINFELEIQQLQQEVQNMKALCLMNVEKLDYNYAVLKCREEENIIVKNQQKRRINKLQDTMNSLKKTYTDLEESTRLEIQKLTNEILKSQKAILDLEEKSNHLASINDRKYMQIWDMNIDTANELVDKILTADRIIHEQLLGVEWKPPTQKLLKKEDLPSYCGAMCALKQEKEETRKRKLMSKLYEPATTLEEINLERRLLNHIAKLVSNQCDYLIEDTLKELLSDYTENDKLLIRLDKIFEALKITSEQDLQFLLNFFLPYAHCPTCEIKTVSVPSVCGQPDKTTETSSSMTTLLSVCGNDKTDLEEAKLVTAVQEALCSTKFLDKEDTVVVSSTPEVSLTKTPSEDVHVASTCIGEGIIETANADGKSKRLLVCDKGHLLVIETEFVTNALREFVERYEFIKKEENTIHIAKKVLQVKATVSRNITEEDITEFWHRYKNIFPPEKESLWDNLLIGLKKYYEVLKERHKLNAETESLRKQNAELSHLLKSYSAEPTTMKLTEKDTNLLQHIFQD
ncbi:dynein regulatory complex protein 1 isoform X1 [Hylaeus volcanicus]|uniref:dynein regulatory complex protein 1 isoform X1 n=2 Tax=Hylaeus volcanicus TaxID=313075 RepID=UPI0023B86FCB|nr:dynein regulatory complex protein 1 isoform X1 [Hylaeus volcanicus]